MKKFIIRAAPSESRQRCIEYIQQAVEGQEVTIKDATRTSDQNAKFHAICSDLAKSDLTWAGKRRTAIQWKVLLVSGHAAATKEETEMVPGIEGEFVNLRESTAQMSVRRGASLITYSLAFCDLKCVQLSREARV